MGPNDIGYANGIHQLPVIQLDELNFICGPAGHDYAISGPFHESDAAGRSYDLICPKCGDAKSVTVQAG